MNKAKLIFLGAVVGAVLVGVFAFQQQKSLAALRKEMDTLKPKAAQLAPLQEELNRTKQDAAGVSTFAETEKHDLLKLRSEVATLRAQSNQLVTARQQIQKMSDRISALSGSLNEAQAAQAELQKQQSSQANQNRDACINNLRSIDAAIQQWALENKKQPTDSPTPDDLKPYLIKGPNGDFPQCPDGGTYTVTTVAEKPKCSIAGHVLP